MKAFKTCRVDQRVPSGETINFGTVGIYGIKRFHTIFMLSNLVLPNTFYSYAFKGAATKSSEA